MRLIDADAVKHSIWREWLCSITTKEKELCNILEKIIDRCCEHIDAAPTVEAVPVRHGHWIEKIDAEAKDSTRRRFYCSVCGKWQTYGRTNYCPNCGAKMDEVSE